VAADAGTPDSQEDLAGEPVETEEERRRRRRRLTFLLTPYVLAVVSGTLAAAFLPALLAEHPLALIALDARNRNLVLAANSLDPVPYFTVATLRLLAVDPFMYLVGLWYGDAAVRWVERRMTGLKETIAWLERFFRRAGPLAVALFPGPVICTLAGATGMRVPVFLAFNVVGTIARVALFWWVGDIFSGPVDSIREFFDRYIVWTTAASVVLVALWVMLERRRGAADAETPVELAEELEAEIEAETAADDGDDRDAPGHGSRP